MERIILLIIKNFYRAPIWFIRICKCADSNKEEKDKYQLLRNIIVKINKSANVNIEYEGIENLPKENGFVMFPNHQGLFDVLMMIDKIDKPFTFVMKKELENNFFLKRIIKLLDAKTIDREDVRQSMKIIMKMAQEVKLGRNYVIFAEGTRSKRKNCLLDFKGGSFKSATMAKAPIVPIAIMDSYKVFDNHSIEETTTKMSILKPIYYEEYKDMKTTEIALEVKKRIENKISEIY